MIKTSFNIELSKEEVYAATDPTYARCLPCMAKPIRRCIICDDAICSDHLKKVLGSANECPLCYAIELVHGRKFLTVTLQKVYEKRKND